MKTIFTLVIAIVLSSVAHAEDIEVYLCESRFADVEWGDKGDEANTTFLTFYRLGKRAGKIMVADFALLVKNAKALKTAKAHEPSGPFYGPGFNYILKDSKGDHYIAFFEYEEGHQTFNGFRVALNHLRPIGSIPNVFEGSPFNGTTSFNEDLLSQLKILTKKTAAKNAVGNRK